jgi:hypothetical protein
MGYLICRAAQKIQQHANRAICLILRVCRQEVRPLDESSYGCLIVEMEMGRISQTPHHKV